MRSLPVWIVAFLACAAPTGAQQPDSTRALARSAQSAAVPAPLGAPAEVRVRTSAAPRSINVVTVPVPLPFRENTAVAFAITPLGGATLIPPLTGDLAPAAGPRTVLVAASVPASALAGVRNIALVRFSQGALQVDVPVDLEVTQVDSATLRLVQQLVAAQPGDRITVRYVLTNTGNGPDTFTVVVAGPPRWDVGEQPRPIILGPGQTTSGEATVTVPRASVSGVYRITVAASAGARRIAGQDVAVELLEATTRTASGGVVQGPRLVAGMASVLTNAGSASPVLGFELQGPVADQVQVFGRLVQPTDPANVDQRSVARVGYFVGAPFLTVAAPRWQATGGTTGRSFSDVTGVSAFGRGGSFNWTDGSFEVAGLAADPMSGTQGGPAGHLLGLRLGESVWRPGAQVNATVTDLDDPQLVTRRLQAFGVGAVTPPFSGVTVSGEIAERRFEGNDGLGWSTELKRQTREEFGQIRVVHAPGGSAAFAHARDEISAVASRTVGSRLFVGAGLWNSEDDSPTFSRLHSRGWSVAPRYTLNPQMALDVELRDNAFDAQSATGLLGNGETTLRVGLSSQRGPFFLSGAGTIGSARQTAAIPGGPSIETSGGRQSLRAGGGLVTDRGTFEASASFEHSAAGIGLLPTALVFGVRATGVVLTRAVRSPLASAEVQYYGWFGGRPGATVARFGLVAPLPGNLSFAFDMERNPFLAGVGGGARWVPVVKIERTMRLPLGALQPVAKGAVYEDRNGNGVRDPGEPALAGAVVKRGEETIVTDRSGRFRFYDKSSAVVRLDETSLPFGMVPNTAAPIERQRPKAIAIGVIPTLDAEVQLVAWADSSGRMPHVEFTGVPVQVVDSAGQRWSTRADSTGRAHFSALPPGEYHLEFDFSGLREPVRLRTSAPTFTVEPGHPVPLLTVPVYPRPLRIFDPARGGRGAGGRGTP